MKKLILSLFLSIIVCASYSQTIIQMEESGGVYKIPCLVNGAKMKFIFDTGASNVCLSETMAEYMLENDYLDAADILESGTSTVADGREVNHIVVNLKDVEIAGLHLKNIQAVVIEGQNAPLLLGQTAIQQLGSIAIDGDRLTIHNESNITAIQLEELYNQVENYCNNKYFLAAIECLHKIENYENLDAFWLYTLAYCYSHDNQPKECIAVCDRWIKEYDANSSQSLRSEIYGIMGGSYYYDLKDYKNAILWYQKQLPLIKDDTEWWLSQKSLMAQSYAHLKDYNTARRLSIEIIEDQLNYLGVTIEDVMNSKVKNEDLGKYILRHFFVESAIDQHERNYDYLASLAAKCGYRVAVDFCIGSGISYIDSKKKRD
ncbi:MAG: retropepsin-like aspartic protease [Rikenellaceae bacterium]